MAAMIEVQSLGADALLLERNTKLGGSAVYAAGAMLFSGTPIQAGAGVSDGPDALLADWPEMTGGDATAPWVVRYAEENVSEVYDWLSAMGAGFWLSEDQQNNESVPRLHMFGGEGDAMVGLLASQIPRDALILGAEAQALVMDADGVEGVLITDTDGTEAFIEAEVVVVATGGFLRDLSLVSWADPDLLTAALWFSTGPDTYGSGHHMLSELGADWLNPGAIGMYAHGVPDPHEEGEEVVLTSLANGIWVNVDGEQFIVDPQTNSYTTAQTVVEQPDQRAWAIFDADNRPEDEHFFDPLVPPGTSPSQVTMDDLLDAGFADEADALSELAGLVGIDADGLEASAGELSSPPYLAVRIAPALAKSFGGIAVDDRGQVLAGGVPLPGVYAAGELTGMAGGSLVGETGFTGSFSAVLLSGRIAGRSAAE